MGGVNLSVHPLFFAFSFYYALTGRFLTFVIYTITAVAHELGHSLVATNAGYKLNKITLMPFGAVVKGDIEGLKLKDEIKIALAGPLLNFAIALFFVSCWWVFPEIYAFTDVVVEANLSMAIFNLLPVFPLDGGRVINATLKSKLRKNVANGICNALSITFSLVLVALFVVSLRKGVNFSLLFFSAFVLFGAFGKARENEYVRLYKSFSPKRLKNGVEVKRIAVDKSVKLKNMMSLFDENKLNEIDVYEKDKKITSLSFSKTVDLLEKGDLYSPISKYL
jgi:stage IV sporulation protein FB